MRTQHVIPAPVVAPEPLAPPSPWRAMRSHLTLAIVCLLAILNFVDRMLLASAMPLIKAEFVLSDTALGILSGSFAIVYATAGLPVGWLADRYSRRHIITGMAALWSVMTAACGVAGSFAALLAARLGVALGEAGYMPAVYSSMSDMYPPARRNFIFSLIIAACSVGVIGGLALGGWLASSYGWRNAFLYVGLAGLLLVLVVVPVIHEPARGGQEESRTPAAGDDGAFSFGAGLRRLLGDRVIFWSLITTGFTGYCNGVVQWLPSFFARSHGMSLITIGLLFGSAFGVGLMVGQLLGGRLAERMARRRLFAPLKLCIVSNLLMVPAFALIILSPHATLAIAATLVMSFCGGLGSPVLTAAIQNAAPPRLRGVAHALLTLALSVVGLGIGPLAVGMVSDALAPRLGAAAGLRWALLGSTGMFVIATVCAWAACRAGARRA